jgi:hypothetical protein
VPGKLDLQRVTINHSARRLYFSIKTHDRWKARILGARTQNQVQIHFKTQPGRDGYTADVQRRHSELKVLIIPPCSKSCDPFYTGTRRPDRRTVSFSVGRKRVTANGDWVKWVAQTLYSTYPDSESACYSGCFDSIPTEAGWVYYPLK